MALIKMKPTSPGRRGVLRVKAEGLYQGRPYAPLVESKNRTGGRNSGGRITTRHIGGGHKQFYRIIDFARDKQKVVGAVERLEHDPNRNAHIALICYADGERRYIIAPKGLAVGDSVVAGSEAPIKVGNSMPLRHIPVGSTVHCVELFPGKGAQLARSAGSSAMLLGRDAGYAQLRLRSGEVRRVLVDCQATLGEVGNAEHSLAKLGKAGAKRWRGVRPTVRGEVMNPIDHPHGGRTRGNRHPCSPWGQPTKGYKTRKNKRTNGMILTTRHKAKSRG